MPQVRSYQELVDMAREDKESRVSVERSGQIVTVCLNDPAKFNPLGIHLGVELRDKMQDVMLG